LKKIDEARAESYRREGDKRTIERIAERLASERKCPPEACPKGDGCQAHWMQYLTGEAAE